MTLQERAEIAVLSKIESSLNYIQEELADMGLTNLDLSGMANTFSQEFHEFYEDKEEDDKPVELRFGVDDQTQPNALARSIMCNYIRGWLSELFMAVGTIEEGENEKLEGWAIKNSGKECEIDFKSLVAIKKDLTGKIVKFLNAAYLIMNCEAEHFEEVISQTSDAELVVFMRDLVTVRLSDSRIESVLLDLLEVSSPDIIDEVLGHQEIKEHKEFQAIEFLGKLLKKAIENEIKDEDWKTMHDDLDESEKAA